MPCHMMTLIFIQFGLLLVVLDISKRSDLFKLRLYRKTIHVFNKIVSNPVL